MNFRFTPPYFGLAKLSLVMLIHLSCQLVLGQIISPHATEVQFSYTATFQANRNTGLSKTDLASFHISHLFGLFQSPSLINTFDLNPEQVAGIGAPRNDMKIQIISSRIVSQYKLEITYSVVGKMILHNKVAQDLVKSRSIKLPMPADPYEIYDEKCTDDHYTLFSDYWYFYDAFRGGCEKLSRPPLAIDVNIRISALPLKNKELTARLDLLRGANDNGDLFLISVIHGFEASATNPYDDGRLNFDEFNYFLRQNHFSERKLYEQTSRPQSIFNKSLTLANGKIIQVEIRHLLVETGILSKTISFAKFFKSAVESSDVIVYAGHSGLGGNLDISALEEKAGKFKFNSRKRQIFFFDSCSSYSYYLSSFSAEKTKAKIDILSNGLPSYFMYGGSILKSFIGILLNTKINDAKWDDILQQMERPLKGGTYLLNVGGI